MTTKGFSLIEILIATLILAIVSLSLFTCINYSFKNVLVTREGEIAINLCQEEIEIIKKFPSDAIPCPATFTPTWYKKGSKYYSGYPIGSFPPVLYPATYTTCTHSDPTMCTSTTLLHDHKDLLVSIGLGTQTTNGTKTIITQWIDSPETIFTNQDYKRIKVIIEWRKEGINRFREISTYISKK